MGREIIFPIIGLSQPRAWNREKARNAGLWTAWACGPQPLFAVGFTSGARADPKKAFQRPACEEVEAKPTRLSRARRAVRDVRGYSTRPSVGLSLVKKQIFKMCHFLKNIQNFD
jgi:hypothetical protein